MPTSYRGEITFGGRTYRSHACETRELAAVALLRLLGNRRWLERLVYTETASGCLRVVEVEEPADVHALAGLSLADFSESLRRRLYDQVVADYFVPKFVVEDGVVSAPLPYGPDAAGLTVFYCLGRWFVAWRRLERTDGTEEDRSELLRIHSTEHGIVYHEV